MGKNLNRTDWDALPKIIQEVGLNFHWDNKKVWELKVPVENISLSKLEWQFDVPFWDWAGQRYVITPNQVMQNQEKYAAEYQRIMAADMAYPIEIMQNQKGWWECLDGLHRVAKAKILGMEEIGVKKVLPEHIPSILREGN